jgi:RNA polymerase sigma-70 factor (ECF subfamily)
MRFFPWKKKSSLSDEELIQSYHSSGDKAFVGELYIRYAHLMYGVCLKYYRDREQSRDAVLQIFEKLFGSLKTHTPENVKTWLMFVARNYCISELRKLQVKAEKQSRYAKDEEVLAGDDEDLIDDKVLKEQRLQRLEDAISTLNEEQKICIELFYLKDKSYREIADITGMSDKQVKSHIQNGKRNLKLILEQ